MTDIYFRTDGNSEIATGHLMRCLAIARACAQNHANVTFIVSDEESLTLLRERFAFSEEFNICCLHRNYKDLESEIPALLACLSVAPATDKKASDNKPWIFIDSYYATTSYFMHLSGYFRTAYLDDLRNLDCAVNLVINYDSDVSCSCYDNAGRRLLGVQYTPLREQFHAPFYEVRPDVKHILLSTGGTDPFRVAESLLQMIYDSSLSCDHSHSSLLQSMHYHVLTSRTNSRYDTLCSLAQEHPSIHIHTNVTEVAALMASCDLAVSAGGTTLCELCAVGVPSVSYLMAENQRTAVEIYSVKNLIPCAGDIRPIDFLIAPAVSDSDTASDDDSATSDICTAAFGIDSVASGINSTVSDIDADASGINTASFSDHDKAENLLPNRAVLSRILDFLATMAQDPAVRAKTSDAMRSYLDGSGAEQIAQALLL